jgi:hypothetical protein
MAVGVDRLEEADKLLITDLKIKHTPATKYIFDMRTSYDKSS